MAIENFDDYVSPIRRRPETSTVPVTPGGTSRAPSNSAREPPGRPFDLANWTPDMADIDKAIPAGLARGITGAIGLPGSIGEFTRWGANKLGVPENVIDAGAYVARNSPLLRVFTGPSGSDVQHKLEEYTGKLYEPTTPGGRYASTLAEFAPGAIFGAGGALPRIVNTVTGATGSHLAGELTKKGTAAEPWARAIGGVLGGVVGGKAVTPVAPPTRTYQEAVDVLKDARVPLSAGDKLDSRMLRMLESVAGDSMLSSGLRKQQLRDQAAGLNRAYTEKTFDPAALTAPSPRPGGLPGVAPDATLPRRDVMEKGVQTLGDEYDRISAANRAAFSPRLNTGLHAPIADYANVALDPARNIATLERIKNSILDKFILGQPNAAGVNTISGQQYQTMRSDLGKQVRAAMTGPSSDPALGAALGQMQKALDQAFAAGLSPADAAAWARNNVRYGNMKQIEGAVARAPGENLTAPGVAASVRSGRSGPYARGAGDLDELTNAANTVLRPLPNSNTAPRTSLQNLPTNVMTLGGAVPYLAITKPGQWWLGNQVAPQNVRDIISQTMAQQGISQPGGIERNEAAQADYEAGRWNKSEEVDPNAPQQKYTEGDYLPYYQG